MKRPGSKVLLWLGAGVMTAIGACSKDALGPNAAVVESVLVAPSTATVAVGSNLTLSAEIRDADGNLLASPHVSWASADASIAEVSPTGVVTGRKVGAVLISASARGRDAFSRITVNPTPVATVRLSLTSRAMLIGQSVQLVAEPLDNGGRVLTGRPVSWSSSDAAVATVTDSGTVTALAAGAAIITASSEGKSAVATITVSLVPVASIEVTPAISNVVVAQTSQLQALLRDATGATLTGRMVSWSSSGSSVATVTSDGLVTAVATGTATITASSEGRSGSATVNVSARPASAVIVSPGQSTIFASQIVQLGALVTDDRGQVLPGKPVSFSTSNSQVATVSASGLVTGVSTGSATITATSEGATGIGLVTVAPDPVAAVDVSPPLPGTTVGGTVQLIATPLNAAGQPLTGRTVTWSSGTPTLASVSSTGLVIGLAPGNAVIVATVEGKQGSAMVQVRLVPVATVSVTPSTANISVGQTVGLSATPRDASGNPLSGRIVGWSSSDNTIAAVSSAGVVTAVASGSVTITASSEGQAGTAAVIVGVVPVATVSVAPAQSTLTVGQTVTLVANPMDAAGQPLSGRSVTWTSGSPNVASVSGAGVVTGISAGAAVITATVDGVPGSASVVVNAPPAASVTVTPSSQTLTVGQTATLGATVSDAGGNVITGASVTWSSSNAAIATVSASGVVSAVGPGSATITASSGTASGAATITVNYPPLHHIIVAPANPRIKIGQTVQMTATGYDSSNNVIPGITFAWSSSNANKAPVSGTGLVTGRDDGNSDISASASGKSGKTRVTVEK